MNDQDLNQAWTTLEPTDSQSRRINRQVFAWLDAHDTSLAAEWLGLVTIAPFSALGLAVVAAVALVAATPLGLFARALAGALM